MVLSIFFVTCLPGNLQLLFLRLIAFFVCIRKLGLSPEEPAVLSEALLLPPACKWYRHLLGKIGRR